MTEDEVKKWSGRLVGRLRDLTVFKELPGLTSSKSSGLTKARAAGGAAASDEGAPSLPAGSEPGSLSAGEEKKKQSQINFRGLKTSVHEWEKKNKKNNKRYYSKALQG